MNISPLILRCEHRGDVITVEIQQGKAAGLMVKLLKADVVFAESIDGRDLCVPAGWAAAL